MNCNRPWQNGNRILFLLLLYSTARIRNCPRNSSNNSRCKWTIRTTDEDALITYHLHLAMSKTQKELRTLSRFSLSLLKPWWKKNTAITSYTARRYEGCFRHCKFHATLDFAQIIYNCKKFFLSFVFTFVQWKRYIQIKHESHWVPDQLWLSEWIRLQALKQWY